MQIEKSKNMICYSKTETDKKSCLSLKKVFNLMFTKMVNAVEQGAPLTQGGILVEGHNVCSFKLVSQGVEALNNFSEYITYKKSKKPVYVYEITVNFVSLGFTETHTVLIIGDFLHTGKAIILFKQEWEWGYDDWLLSLFTKPRKGKMKCSNVKVKTTTEGSYGKTTVCEYNEILVAFHKHYKEAFALIYEPIISQDVADKLNIAGNFCYNLQICVQCFGMTFVMNHNKISQMCNFNLALFNLTHLGLTDMKNLYIASILPKSNLNDTQINILNSFCEHTKIPKCNEPLICNSSYIIKRNILAIENNSRESAVIRLQEKKKYKQSNGQKSIAKMCEVISKDKAIEQLLYGTIEATNKFEAIPYNSLIAINKGKYTFFYYNARAEQNFLYAVTMNTKNCGNILIRSTAKNAYCFTLKNFLQEHCKEFDPIEYEQLKQKSFNQFQALSKLK